MKRNLTITESRRSVLNSGDNREQKEGAKNELAVGKTLASIGEREMPCHASVADLRSVQHTQRLQDLALLQSEHA